jgi:hypothetical protein
MDDADSPFACLLQQRRNLFEPEGRSTPISPVPGDTVVLMAANPGQWGEDAMPIETVLDDGTDWWLVRVDDGAYVIQRGSDGRWWTYGALSEQSTR